MHAQCCTFPIIVPAIDIYPAFSVYPAVCDIQRTNPVEIASNCMDVNFYYHNQSHGKFDFYSSVFPLVFCPVLFCVGTILIIRISDYIEHFCHLHFFNQIVP
jgi:hypothetical protein